MVNKRKFALFEDDQLKDLDSSIKYIKDKTRNTLDNKVNGELFKSARDSRLNENNQLNNNSDFWVNNSSSNDSSNSLGNSESLDNQREKVRVRTMPNIGNAPIKTPTTLDNNIQNPSNYYNGPSEEIPDSYRNSGVVTVSNILIVLASFVIIAMLVMIYLTLSGFIGS